MFAGYFEKRVEPDYLGYCKVLFFFPFYVVGYLSKKKGWILQLPKAKGFLRRGIFLVAIAMGMAAILNHGNNISIYTFDLNFYRILFFASVAISFGIRYCMSYPTGRSKFLQPASKDTLFMMWSHYFLLFLWDKWGLPELLAGSWIKFIAIIVYLGILDMLY